MTRIVRSTPLGEVAGVSNGRCLSWLGLQYAHAARWEPPTLVEAWAPAVLEATSEGPSCPQPPNLESSSRQSEECLLINVFMPVNGPPANRTLAWIHGGGFTSGSIGRIYGGAFAYNGCDIAAERGIAVVTVQYRLGALGWISRRGAIKANLGLRDTNMALRFARRLLWPMAEKMLLFGQSSGSEIVAAHLSSQQMHSAGLDNPPLFHAAALLEGFFVGKDPQTADTIADLFLTFSQCATIKSESVESACTSGWTPAALDCLRNLSIAEVLAVQSRIGRMEMEESSQGYRFVSSADSTPAAFEASSGASYFSMQVKAKCIFELCSALYPHYFHCHYSRLPVQGSLASS